MSVCSIRTHNATFQPTQGPEQRDNLTLLPKPALGSWDLTTGSLSLATLLCRGTDQAWPKAASFKKKKKKNFFFTSREHTGQSKIQTCNELGGVTVKLREVGGRGLLHICNYRSTISMHTFRLCVYGARNQVHGFNIHKAHTILCGPRFIILNSFNEPYLSI